MARPSSPQGQLALLIDLAASVTTVSSGGTLGTSSSPVVILVASGGAPVLPTAVGNTTVYTIKNIHSANRSIATTNSETIDGGAAPITLIPGQSLTLVSDGANWRII